jgi:hypothetical protein
MGKERAEAKGRIKAGAKARATNRTSQRPWARGENKTGARTSTATEMDCVTPDEKATAPMRAYPSIYTARGVEYASSARATIYPQNLPAVTHTRTCGCYTRGESKYGAWMGSIKAMCRALSI